MSPFNVWLQPANNRYGVWCDAVPHPEHHFVHGVQLRQVLLGVGVPVVEVDGSGGSMAGLSDHSPQRPRQLVDQVRADDHILDQTSRWTGSRGRHVHHVPEVMRLFVFRFSHRALLNLLYSIPRHYFHLVDNFEYCTHMSVAVHRASVICIYSHISYI